MTRSFLLQLLPGEHAARGVVRVAEQHHPCVARSLLKPVEIDLESPARVEHRVFDQAPAGAVDGA
jgi:hypothetical protein